jgi:adenylate cyclase
VILPLPFSHGHSYACSWATREPGGFSDTAIARIVQIMPVFSLVLEILATRRIARNLMDTYIGHSAGERVLSGEIYRGVNEPIEAVVWISDLRGFTRLSDEFAPPVVLGILNDHFERVVGAIADQGGEVLKFIGDGMLAIFEIGDIADARAQCLAALDAAAAARDAIAALNRERGEAPEIRWGLALDLGEVYYGNVGTPDRLDFTVIGKAVNLASRLEAIAADIGEPVVASQAFADASGVPMRDLGYHKVKGFEAPQAAFAPER